MAETVAARQGPAGLTARNFTVLVILGAVGLAASIPGNRIAVAVLFNRQLSAGAVTPAAEHRAAMAIAVVSAIVTVILATIGLGAARRVAIDALPLIGSARETRRFGRLWRAALVGLALAAFSVALVLIEHRLFGAAPAVGHRSPLRSLHSVDTRFFRQASSGWSAVSLVVGAPVLEEMQLRLFWMSAIAWLGGLWWPRSGDGQSRRAIWLAIIISGLSFGLMHVASGEGALWWYPVWVQAVSDPRTWAGAVLGVVFWRWGVESSIATHATMNAVVLAGAAILTRLRP